MDLLRVFRVYSDSPQTYNLRELETHNFVMLDMDILFKIELYNKVHVYIKAAAQHEMYRSGVWNIHKWWHQVMTISAAN